ncbi:family 4 glycosyl hydrolase, partial [Microbacterium gubbeenense]
MVNIAFIGAGSVVFTRQLVADILRYPELADVRLVLHDIDDARLAVAAGTAKHVNDRFGTSADVTATTDRRTALEGADYVINMVQVGGIDATLADLQIPAAHGLRQTIGDTTGIGGVFRALRTFPVLTAIADDMREL